MEDPRKPGGRYLCGYWQEEYEVLSIDEDGWITVQWADGRPGLHITPWTPSRDKVIREP
jgi:hypothetical protein